jgi:hypothetical protein
MTDDLSPRCPKNPYLCIVHQQPLITLLPTTKLAEVPIVVQAIETDHTLKEVLETFLAGLSLKQGEWVEHVRHQHEHVQDLF